MKVVHYTKPFFKLHPIIIKNNDGTRGLLIKPGGGLWCSPLDSVYGWKEWCKDNDYADIEHKQRVILDVDNAKLLTIDSFGDMENKLPWYELHGKFPAIDFEKLVNDGIEGIILTTKGQTETRYTHPRSLYGWDCETVLIMSEKCIRKLL